MLLSYILIQLSILEQINSEIINEISVPIGIPIVWLP